MSNAGYLMPLLTKKLKFLGKIRQTEIDNTVFKLHYRWTFNAIVVAVAMVSAYQFFGFPISCLSQAKTVNPPTINNYCWVEGTFTLPKALTKVVGEEVVMPGIEKKDGQDIVLNHKYYQWVPFFLFLQGILFYLPHFLWKVWEKGNIKTLIFDLNKTIIEPDKKEKSEAVLVHFLAKRRGEFNRYAQKYLICEILNFLHVIAEFYITNAFLGGQFLDYGYQALFFKGGPEDINPLVKVFPKMTKCTFRHYGSSGDVQIYDNFCLLPLNVLNEKIYILFWIWLVILSIISGLAVAYRIFCFSYPPIRYRLLQVINRRARPQTVITLVNSLSYGDWFLLYLLGQNIEPAHFSEVLELFAFQLEQETFALEKGTVGV